MNMKNSLFYTVFIVLTLSVSVPDPLASEPKPNSPLLDAALACRQEVSPLLRLDCYDKALMSEGQSVATPSVQQKKMGAAWQRAMAQERQRNDHSTTFLVSNSGGDNPQVVLTTPAIGLPPPRSVLMLSCVDNITRLQVALAEPYQSEESKVTLTTEQTHFNAIWFVREAGFVLESSRGLSGIDDIRRLFGSKTLTVSAEQSALRLVFNIDGLLPTLAPLRQACHW